MILQQTTFGVSSIGNTKALLMCLSSVLNGTVLPSRIQIRFEGELPNFDEFYLAQLSDLARFHGVEWTMTVAKPQGVRAARDFHLKTCPTDFLWMGDDDAVYSPECLQMLSQVYLNEPFLTLKKDSWAYICGSKGDVNNRRGYKNFQMKIYGPEDVHDNCAFNWFYDIQKCEGRYVKIWTADTGNILFNLLVIRRNNLRFEVFEESTNSGGEDTIFALECNKLGLEAYFVPSARAYHLEKPRVTFDEFAARAEMVLRVADYRGYRPETMRYVKETFMPWNFKK